MCTSVRLAPLFALLVLLAVHPIPAAAVETEELQILEEPGYVPTPEEEMLPAEVPPADRFLPIDRGPWHDHRSYPGALPLRRAEQ